MNLSFACNITIGWPTRKVFKNIKQLMCQSTSLGGGAGNFMIVFNHLKHLQSTPPHIHVWPGYWKRTEITENRVAGLKSWGVTSLMEISFTQSSCFSFLIFPLWRSISRCKRSISFLWWSISSWWCCFSAASCSCSLRLRCKKTGWEGY